VPSSEPHERACSRRSFFFTLALLGVVLAACGGSSDSDERDFAEAISAENQRWVEQGERPLADLVLRLSSQPSTVVDRRAEVVATLDSLVTLTQQASSATEELDAPSDEARACQQAQLERISLERGWIGGLRLAIGQMADASAIAMLPSFRDLAPAITKADEICSSFVEQAD